MFSHLSLVWAKTLSSATWVCTVTSSLLSVRMFIPSTCTQSVRFAPIALGLVISFASDARYSISDVRPDHIRDYGDPREHFHKRHPRGISLMCLRLRLMRHRVHLFRCFFFWPSLWQHILLDTSVAHS